MFSEKVMRQFDQHNGQWCIERQQDESIETWMIDEIIHFMNHHRWWTHKEIMEEMEPGEYNRTQFIIESLSRDYTCNPS